MLLQIEYNKLPAQDELDRIIGRPDLARAVLFSGGFGSGKTYALCHAALKLSLLNLGCYGGAVSPTYKMQIRAVIPTLKMILIANNIPYHHAKSDNEIWLLWDGGPFTGEMRPTISCIHLCSADNPDSLKGPNWAWYVIDEPGLLTREAYIFANSRMRDMSGPCRQAVLCGTPEDIFDNPWVPEFFIDPATRRVRYAFVRASTRDSVKAGVVDPEFLDSLLETMTDEMAQAYVDGEFVSFKSGAVYSAFTMRLHTDANLFYAEELPLMVGLDFNVAPMCGVIAQRKVADEGVGIDVINEIKLPRPSPGKSATREWCKVFKDRYPPKAHQAGVMVFGDATGKAQKSSATDTDWGIVAEELGEYRNYGASVPEANPGEWDRVVSVNNALEKGFVTVSEQNCPFLIRDLVRTPKKQGTNAIDKKKDHDLTHLSDGLGYMIWKLAQAWGLGAAAGGVKVGKSRRRTAGRQWDHGMVVGV